MISPHPYTAGKPHISYSYFVYISHEQLLLYPEKKLERAVFTGFFMQTAAKYERETQHINEKLIPITYTSYTPEESAFSDPIFLVFCQLRQTYFLLYNESANKMSALARQHLDK